MVTYLSNDFIAGLVAGLTCKIFEHPFDTIKVLQQTTSSKSVWGSFADVVKLNGFRGLYKGVIPPLLSCTFETALIFYIYELAKKNFTEKNPPPVWTIAVSGAIAGACTPIIVTPIEFVKCNLQVQANTVGNPRFTGAWDCLAKTMKEKGTLGIYKGYLATVLRDSPGSSLWFLAYEMSSRMMTKPGQTKEDLPLWKLTASGSFSGIAYWSAFFPADVIKSKLQTQQHQGQTFWSLFKHIWKTSGLHGLYRGFGVTVLRAIPSNGILFASYESCKRLLHSFTHPCTG